MLKVWWEKVTILHLHPNYCHSYNLAWITSFKNSDRFQISLFCFWASDLVWDLDEEAEAFRRLQQQPGWNVLAEVLCFGAGLHFKCLQVWHKYSIQTTSVFKWHFFSINYVCVLYLIRIIREVDFVEDLCRLMLDCLHFYQMRWILPGSITITVTTLT